MRRDLKAKETHTYLFRTNDFSFLRIRVEQEGIDLVLALKSADNKLLVEVDSPTGPTGIEELEWLGAPNTTFLIEIRALEECSDPGAYLLQRIELRDPTADDQKRINLFQRRNAAIRLYELAARLFDTGTRTSLLEAIDHLRNASEEFSALGDLDRAADSTLGIGRIRHRLGDVGEALEILKNALNMQRDDSVGEATTLNSIGLIYDQLNHQQEAIEFYDKARSKYKDLRIKTESDDEKRRFEAAEAMALHNKGDAQADLGQSPVALKTFEEALTLRRSSGDAEGEASTLTQIGHIRSKQNEYAEALRLYRDALAIHTGGRAVNHEDAANILMSLGNLYHKRGLYFEALVSYKQALAKSYLSGNGHAQGEILGNLIETYGSLRNPSLAVFYGKMAVNTFQAERSRILGLDKDLHSGYLRSAEFAYRRLSFLLIKSNRNSEAQQVLNSLKDQVLFDFEPNKELPRVDLTKVENAWAEALSNRIAAYVATGSRLSELRARYIGEVIPKGCAGHLAKIRSDDREANEEYLKHTGSLEVASKANRDTVAKPVTRDTWELQSALRTLAKQTGESPVFLYTVQHDGIYAGLIVTADRITSFINPSGENELIKKQLTFLRQLSAIDTNTGQPMVQLRKIKETSQELYLSVFRPIETKLRHLRIRPTVIMWSLDGALRYLPMGALFDGKMFLVERFRSVVITRMNSRRLLAPVKAGWSGIGFFDSKPHVVPVKDLTGRSKLFGFEGLKNAAAEVENIFGGKEFQPLIKGTVYGDEAFTKKALFEKLLSKPNLVHIAGHFQYEAGSNGGSFLVLGDGTTLTLEELKSSSKDLFSSVELLTLSTCESGVQRERESDGREIDGLAELAQRKGAGAVLASLWKVDDESTAELMTVFYRLRKSKQRTKLSALQAAQISLLRSESYSHPYYWAPFVLTGNWK